MSDAQRVDRLLRELAEDLAVDVTRRYRLDRADAAALILDDLSRRADLVRAIDRSDSLDEVRRLRLYRDARDDIKRGIYHRLRRYRPDDEAAVTGQEGLDGLAAGAAPALVAERARAVAAAHVSTAERMPHLPEFLDAVGPLIGAAESVVDVGCGVLPLVFPLDEAPGAGIREYWALDKDPQAIAPLRSYARLRDDGRVRPLQWDLAEGWRAAFADGLRERCDVGLLLKVVAVVARRAPDLLPTLAETPADRLVVSGSRVAMTRHQDIERREVALLRRFFAVHGLVETASFRTTDEVGFLVERAT